MKVDVAIGVNAKGETYKRQAQIIVWALRRLFRPGVDGTKEARGK